MHRVSATDPVVDRPQLVPPITIKPDRKLPIIILGSLVLHAVILLPLLLPKETAPQPPQEIPVELVQELPKPPPPPPKQDAPKPQPKPPEQKSPEQKPPEKAKPPEAGKSQQKKPDPPKEEKKPAEKPRETTAERMKKLLGEDTPSIGNPENTPLADNAIAMPGMSINGTDSVSYHQLVMSRIAKAKREILVAGKPDAVVVVAFTLSDTGAVASASVKSPSGSPDLDKEALSMVGRGEPFPPPPPGAPRDFTFGLKMRSGP